MKRTRLVVLSDNRTNNKLLQTEHGLSVYLECPSGKYLLDTGASDLFIRNVCIPADTRSPIPVIPVHSVGNLQYMWQS